MFEKYVEKELTRKIAIVNLLWENVQLTSIDLAISLDVTATTIKSDIKSINLYYCSVNEPLIVSETTGYSILNKKSQDKRSYLKRIYSDSLFIRACCFYLKHNFSNAGKLADEEFISVSKAYELKRKVIEYVEGLGIKVADKTIANNECRLRFLITFFQMKVGIDFISISKYNKYQFSKLFDKIEEVENCLLSDYSREYASILLQLDFDRKKLFPVTFDKKSLNLLENTPIYRRLSKPIYSFLKEELHVNIQSEEIFYYALVFNIMNANYYDSSYDSTIFESDTYRSYVHLIKNETWLHYNELVDCFEKEFEVPLRQEPLFEASTINFIRKCIFNIQTLIPEEHVELGNLPQVPDEIFTKICNSLHNWNQKTGLTLIFSDDHIKYFSSKIFFLLRKQERPSRIHLLTSFYTDYLLAKEVLKYEFGNFVDIVQFNPQKDAAEYKEKDLILYDTEYNFLEKIDCPKLKISYVFDLTEFQQIREKLFSYNFDGILREVYED